LRAFLDEKINAEDWKYDLMKLKNDSNKSIINSIFASQAPDRYRQLQKYLRQVRINKVLYHFIRFQIAIGKVVSIDLYAQCIKQLQEKKFSFTRI
jgi:hypothetical protein